MYKPLNFDGPASDPPKSTASTTGVKDALFLVLFLCNVGAVAGLAAGYGFRWLSHGASSGPHNLLLAALVLILAAALASIAWVAFMLRAAKHLIRVSLLIATALSFGAFFVFFSMEVFGAGLVFGLVTLWAVVYTYLIADRVDFASAHLAAACAAVRAHPALLGFAGLALLAQLLWVALWGLALFGLHEKLAGDAADPWVWAVSVLAYYWGQQVVKNTLHCVCAAVVASWWGGARADEAAVTRRAAWRVLSRQLGTVALGSLLMALVRVLHQAVEELQRRAQRRSAALACLSCLAALLQRAVRVFNKFALAFAGVHPEASYAQAGRGAHALLVRRGWTVLLSDALIDNVLLLGAVVVGAVTSAMGVLLVEWGPAALVDGVDSPRAVLAFIGFWGGLAVALTVMGVVESAVAAVFVLFAERPEELREPWKTRLARFAGPPGLEVVCSGGEV